MQRLQHGKVRIVCTLGPATHDTAMLRQLIDAGMNVARLNFSHGTHEDHLSAMENLRAASKLSGEHVAILLDLQGPKIRIGEFSTPTVEVRTGARFTITTAPVIGTADKVSTSYEHLPADVAAGNTILLDDGRVRLRVLEVDGAEVRCEVIVGGVLSAHKGINLPGVPVSAPSFTEKDLDDLAFGIEHDVDFVALSFVRTASDLRDLRKEIARRVSRGAGPRVVAKIEKPQAINDIDAIVTEADAIMVARGDLGVELPPEDVPMLQKMIIRKCNGAGKPVIVATQMLESMIGNASPTRAEASDVANAVMDGCDAVMLSGETSVGKYPVAAVQIMDRIIRKVEGERHGLGRVLDHPLAFVESRHDALGRAACILAEQMHAAAIVAVTRSGETARVLSHYRPGPNIVALTLKPRTLRLLNLNWGVRGMVMEDISDNSDEALGKIQECLLASGVVEKGEYVVLLAGQPFFAKGSTNFIKVEKIGGNA